MTTQSLTKEERDSLRKEFSQTPPRGGALAKTMIRLLDQIDVLERDAKAIAAPDYSDEETFALNRFHNGDRWAAFQLHAFAKKAKAAIDAALQAEEPSRE